MEVKEDRKARIESGGARVYDQEDDILGALGKVSMGTRENASLTCKVVKLFYCQGPFGCL